MITAKVTVALPLSEKDRERLHKALEVYAKTKLEIEEVVDPAIIGGVIVRIKDKLLDNSLRHRQNKIKASIVGVSEHV